MYPANHDSSCPGSPARPTLPTGLIPTRSNLGGMWNTFGSAFRSRCALPSPPWIFTGYRTPQNLLRLRPRPGSPLRVCSADICLSSFSSPASKSCSPSWLSAKSCFDVAPLLCRENHPSRSRGPPSPPTLPLLLLLLPTLRSRVGVSDSVAPEYRGVIVLGEKSKDTGELENPVASDAQEDGGGLAGNLLDRGRRRDSGDHRCCWCWLVGDWFREENPLLSCCFGGKCGSGIQGGERGAGVGARGLGTIRP